MNYDQLTDAGINMDTLMNRLMGNASLIKLFIDKFTADQTFSILCEALTEGNMQKAEHASHTLKGMCGNMSLDTLFALFTEQVNHIRAGNGDKAVAMMPAITAEYDRAISGMRAWAAEN